MIELTIQPKEEGKGRAFSATLVSYVTADRLWAAGSVGDTRPVFMALAGTDTELRPFVANLRLGRKAEAMSSGYRNRGAKFEILKSAGFQCAWQRTPKGCLVSLFAPDLFALDPGMVDPKGVTFCMLPARAWLRPLVGVPVPACVPEDRIADVLALAPLFIAYLDRRTRCPLVPDPRFYVQVLAHALEEGVASWSKGRSYSQEWGRNDPRFEEFNTDVVGLAPGITVGVDHDTLETFLAEQVKAYFAEGAPS